MPEAPNPGTTPADAEFTAGKHVEVYFGQSFPLPENINLDPNNKDYISRLAQPEEDDRQWDLVEIVRFDVVDSESGVRGRLQIGHVITAMEDVDRADRPYGPTGPYTFIAEIDRQSEVEARGQQISVDMFSTDGFVDYATWLRGQEGGTSDSEQYWFGEFNGWVKEATDVTDKRDVVFSASDLPKLRFSVEKDLNPEGE